MTMPVPYIATCGCVVKPGDRCKHMIVRDRERKARFDQCRPSASVRGYGSKWQKARKDFLKTHPICARCTNPATVVDHDIPHKGNLKLFWDRKNWVPLCAHHHSSSKQREERRCTL
jgi:5-methylcytosine-specific restriction endonuclease McrA